MPTDKTKNPEPKHIVPQRVIAEVKACVPAPIDTANSLRITTPAEEDLAYDFIKQLKKPLAIINEKIRKKIIEPAYAAYKGSLALEKELQAPLKEARKIVDAKILAFQEKQQVRADAEYKKQLAKAEKLEAEGQIEKAKEICDEANFIEIPVGKTVIQKWWDIRITDITKIPADHLYLFAATAKGRDAFERYLRGRMNDALRDQDNKPIYEIPGTELYQKETIRA